jgi:hypothetical protein
VYFGFQRDPGQGIYPIKVNGKLTPMAYRCQRAEDFVAVPDAPR